MYHQEAAMEIHQVQTKRDMRRFITFPYKFYRNDPMWIAPLRSEQWAQYDANKNPMLEHCDFTLFLLMEGDQVLGRISAFIDHLAVKHWDASIGLFGAYECIDDVDGSKMLLNAAKDWLRENGVKAMRGPWSFASQEWGLVIKGFTPPPVILAPYNPPYYEQHMVDFGLEKIKDLLVYYIDFEEGYDIPQRYLKVTDRVQVRYNITVRPVDMDCFKQEVERIVDVINVSIANNWGFTPVTEKEASVIAQDLKRLLDPESVLIAEGPDGKAIGFSIPLPDINVLLRGLNGHILPFGWLKLLVGIPKLRQYRLWALGVLPEYHGKGVDALMYRRTYEALAPMRPRIEINYVLEDNVSMNNALRRLGVKDLRKYRIYQMPV
jgi:ribosomal protein S18 acetylase RimI-like enzyme